MPDRLFSDRAALASLCRRRQIRRLSLFGSALKANARRVDLRTAEDLSRYFRDEVLREAEVQYESA